MNSLGVLFDPAYWLVFFSLGGPSTYYVTYILEFFDPPPCHHQFYTIKVRHFIYLADVMCGWSLSQMDS